MIHGVKYLSVILGGFSLTLQSEPDLAERPAGRARSACIPVSVRLSMGPDAGRGRSSRAPTGCQRDAQSTLRAVRYGQILSGEVRVAGRQK